MLPTSSAVLKYLCKQNASTAMIKWPYIGIGAYVENIDLTMKNGNAARQRSLKETNSRFCWISTTE